MVRRILPLLVLLLACRTPEIPRRPVLPDRLPVRLLPRQAGISPRFRELAGPDGRAWLRLLVDLREQPDLAPILALEARGGISRAAFREFTLRELRALSARGVAHLRPLLEDLERRGLVDWWQPIRYMNRVHVVARLPALRELAADPAVARLVPEVDSVRDARRSTAGSFLRRAEPVPPGPSWGVVALELPALWQQGIDGRGVVIGSLDSGVMGDHEALRDARADGPSWFDPVEGRPEPFDTVPHGSEVLACALGRPVRGHALGAAPGARWVAALANRYNSYNNVNMALAADWMLFETRRLDVVLGAWGHGRGSCDDRDLPMIEAFLAAGVLPVFAAGNDGPDPGSCQSPADLPLPAGRGPLAVAAIDRHLRVIDPSSRGPSPCGRPGVFPDLAAPGFRLPVPAPPTPRSLGLASGTSHATGWVGGVAALVFQVAPDLTPLQVMEVLRQTARDLPPAGPDPASGYGLVDPAAAVARARELAGGP